MKKKRFREEQIVKVLREYEGGHEIKDLCRELGITSTTFYMGKVTSERRLTSP